MLGCFYPIALAAFLAFPGLNKSELLSNRFYHRIEKASALFKPTLFAPARDYLKSRKAVFLPVFLLACVRWTGFRYFPSFGFPA
jgi:hypothetical protein